MTHVKRRKLWQTRVSDYLSSEMTVADWCKHNGFRPGQLRYWLRQARETGYTDDGTSRCSEVSQPWACVELADDDCADAASVPVMSTDRKQMAESGVSVRVGAATIDVRRGFDAVLLSEVLRVVVATC
jgi:transposase-like protein